MKLGDLQDYHEEENKHKTGALMRSLYENQSLPWLCGGDLNLMLWSIEKQGGSDFNLKRQLFRQMLWTVN